MNDERLDKYRFGPHQEQRTLVLDMWVIFAPIAAVLGWGATANA
jgi:hypothetical protein